MKEIHFYTNLCNEEQISDKNITDVCVDFISTKNAINDLNMEIVRTTQLNFLRNSWDYIDRGYKVYIHNGSDTIEVKVGDMKVTSKEIRVGHDISRLLIGGAFGEIR